MNELAEFLPEEDPVPPAPVQRGILYRVATGDPDSTAVEVLFVDDAADAFPSEGVYVESAETSGLVDGMAAVVVPPRPPRISPGLAAGAVTLAAGVMGSFLVVLWLLPGNEVNRTTRLAGGDGARGVAGAQATTSPRLLTPVSAPPTPTQTPTKNQTEPVEVPVQAARSAVALAPATPRPGSAVQSRPASPTSSVPSAPRQLPSTTVSRPVDTRVDTQPRAVANVEVIAATPAPETVAAARIPEALPAVAVNSGGNLGDSRPAAADAAALSRTPAPATSSADTVPVRELLARYRSAYDRLDARSAKQIWPTVDERALARAFEGLDSQAVTFDTCDLAVAEARASASCRGSASYVTRVGHRNVQTTGRQWHFQMHKTADRWVIASVQTQ